MKRQSCPKCKRDTWSEKWKVCTSCGASDYQFVATAKAALARADAAGDKRQQKRKTKTLMETFAPTAEEVREQGGVTSGSMRLRPLPGEKCPTCNRKVPPRRG